jgi:UDP-N-acetylmuramoylalanine--D-glutamate ligase
VDAELHGTHNLNNAAAAFAAVRALGTPMAAVAAGLRRFQPLGHRMALAGEVRGVRFYDDSKATNVGAAVTALLGLAERRAVLIAGGRDKLGSYAPLVQALREKGRAVVVIGEAADRIADAVAGALPLVRAGSMQDAVARAFQLAEPGDAVLLSPACSSFDMFKSYAERGDHFVRAVSALTEVRSGS